MFAQTQLGWVCASCTFVNKPTRPGCEMCSGERPEDYEVPDMYQPDVDEILRIQQEQVSMMLYEEVAAPVPSTQDSFQYRPAWKCGFVDFLVKGICAFNH